MKLEQSIITQLFKKKKSPVMIQEHFHQEAISFLNVYVLNNRASVHMGGKKKNRYNFQEE